MRKIDQLWSPPEPVPCQSDPFAWTEEAQARDSSVSLKQLRARTKQQRDICREACPFVAECLASAMKEEGGDKAKLRYGIRGALLPQERESLYRKNRDERRQAA